MIFRPITSRIAARLLNRPLTDYAERTVELAGRESFRMEPVIHLPDELDRVKGHHRDSRPENNLALFSGSSAEQGPTTIHLMRDGVIADGTILFRQAYSCIRKAKRRLAILGEVERIDEAMLASTIMAETYFGHWLADQMPIELLAEERDVRAITLAGTSRPNEPGYRALFDLPARKVETARVDRLWITEDWDFTRDKNRRLGVLRDRLASRFPETGSDRVFIARGNTAVGRSLRNEQELTSRLASDGFEILHPESCTPEEIVRRLRRARLIVGAEGSALAHAVYAAPAGACLLTIIGPFFFNMAHRLPCHAAKLRIAVTIGDPADEDGFSMPVDRLLRCIDLIDRQL